MHILEYMAALKVRVLESVKISYEGEGGHACILKFDIIHVQVNFKISKYTHLTLNFAYYHIKPHMYYNGIYNLKL